MTFLKRLDVAKGEKTKYKDMYRNAENYANTEPLCCQILGGSTKI